MENPDRDLRAGELGIPKRSQEVEKPQKEVTFVAECGSQRGEIAVGLRQLLSLSPREVGERI